MMIRVPPPPPPPPSLTDFSTLPSCIRPSWYTRILTWRPWIFSPPPPPKPRLGSPDLCRSMSLLPRAPPLALSPSQDFRFRLMSFLINSIPSPCHPSLSPSLLAFSLSLFPSSFAKHIAWLRMRNLASELISPSLHMVTTTGPYGTLQHINPMACRSRPHF